MSMALKHGMNKRKKMAKGGDIKHDNSFTPGGVHLDLKDAGGAARRGTSMAGEHVRGAAMAKEAGQHKAHASRTESAKNLHREAHEKLKGERGKDRTNMADGGEVKSDDHPTSTATIDKDKADEATKSMRKAFGFASGGLVDRAMAKRKASATPPGADQTEDDFDVLDEDDDLDSSYTGADSGDEIGEDDIVSRAMKKRKKSA